jgi:hypothetical protein
MSHDQRDFSDLRTKRSICKFFLIGRCNRGDQCHFSHENEEPRELTEKEKVIKEIEEAFSRGTLDNIFKKMLSSADEYKKYYFEIHMKFRGWALMKLNKRSITKDLLNNISLRNVKIADIEEPLKYGYMPIVMHFIMNGFSWYLFKNASNNEEALKIQECFNEIIDQLIKPEKYNIDEYAKMIIESSQYCDPDTYQNSIHIATYYLCDIVIEHVKEQYNYCRKQVLVAEHKKEINDIKIMLGDETFKEQLNIHYNELLAEKTIENNTAFDIFKMRADTKSEILTDFEEKCKKAISKAHGKQDLIAYAIKRYEYNVSNLEDKFKIFFKQIFDTEIKRIRIQQNAINYEELFNKSLDKLHGFSNRYGTKCDVDILRNLLHLANTDLKHKKDELMQKIINKIPSPLMNPSHVIDTFQGLGNIDYLWNGLINSISIENPATFCIDLLNHFFNDKNKGVAESYIGQYLHKLSNLTQKLSSEEKEVIIKKLDVLTSNVRQKIFL